MKEYPQGTLGPYRLEAVIGAGKVATVFRAVHCEVGDWRAVKILPRKEKARHDQSGSFRREGRLAVELCHPNIIRTYESAEVGGFHYIAMELLDGQPLSQIMPAEGPQPLDRAARLLRQLAAALDYLHARGLVHRDLNTRNVFVGVNDRLTLIDFGTALPFDVGDLADDGPRKAKSVRRRRGVRPRRPTDKALLSTDRYGIGMIAYELLTGQKPFRGHSQLVRNIGGTVLKLPRPARALRPDLPPAVDEVLLRQLGKDLSLQYRSAGEFVDALVSAMAERPELEPSMAPAPAG